MTFGELLRQHRLQLGLSQAELAERAGVPDRTLQSWEQGKRTPVSAEFLRVARALGTTADELARPLLEGEGQAAPPSEPLSRRLKRVARELAALAAEVEEMEKGEGGRGRRK
jgi:transcriptional regulator with XRE-family HTH domain